MPASSSTTSRGVVRLRRERPEPSTICGAAPNSAAALELALEPLAGVERRLALEPRPAGDGQPVVVRERAQRADPDRGGEARRRTAAEAVEARLVADHAAGD